MAEPFEKELLSEPSRLGFPRLTPLPSVVVEPLLQCCLILSEVRLVSNRQSKMALTLAIRRPLPGVERSKSARFPVPFRPTTMLEIAPSVLKSRHHASIRPVLHITVYVLQQKAFLPSHPISSRLLLKSATRPLGLHCKCLHLSCSHALRN